MANISHPVADDQRLGKQSLNEAVQKTRLRVAPAGSSDSDSTSSLRAAAFMFGCCRAHFRIKAL